MEETNQKGTNMKLNYFKNFDEIKTDFVKLTLKEQSQELSEVMSNYSRLVEDDMKYCGFLTAQTKQTKNLYDILLFEHEKELDRQS